MEKNRQTGRTTRIVDHIVEQLFSVGECISTDHICFEYENISSQHLLHLIEKVKRRVEIESNGVKTTKSNIFWVDTKKKIPMVHFKIDIKTI